MKEEYWYWLSPDNPTSRRYKTLENCRKRVLEPRICHTWNLLYLWMKPVNSFHWSGELELGFLLWVTGSILTDRLCSGYRQCSAKIPRILFPLSPIACSPSASNGPYPWHSSEDRSQATGAALLVCSEGQNCLGFISSPGQALANHLSVHHEHEAQPPCLELDKSWGIFYTS